MEDVWVGGGSLLRELNMEVCVVYFGSAHKGAWRTTSVSTSPCAEVVQLTTLLLKELTSDSTLMRIVENLCFISALDKIVGMILPPMEQY